LKFSTLITFARFLLDKIADFATANIVTQEENQPKEDTTTKPKPRRRSRSRRHKQSDAACAMEQNGRPCKMKALVGCKYCWHHAAFDPESDYQFCEHVDPNGKKCLVSVPKNSTIKFCQNHKKKHDAEKGDENNQTKKTKQSTESASKSSIQSQSSSSSTTSTSASAKVQAAPPSPATPGVATAVGGVNSASAGIGLGGIPLATGIGTSSARDSALPLYSQIMRRGMVIPSGLMSSSPNASSPQVGPASTSPLAYLANARATQSYFSSTAPRMPPYVNTPHQMLMPHVFGYQPQ